MTSPDARPDPQHPAGYRPSPGAGGTTSGTAAAGSPPDLTLHAEQATGTAEPQATGTTWLRKVVITETRTFTVQVRREEVEIVHGGVDPDHVAPDAFTERHVSVILHTEEPVVSLRTVATERVTLSVRTATSDTGVDAVVRREALDAAPTRAAPST